MQVKLQEITDEDEYFDDDDYESLQLGDYDQEEDLFKINRRQEQPNILEKMLRLRCCAAVAALFRQPSGAVRSLWWVISRNVLLILVYYVLSIGLTFYQNQLLKKIHFPLTVVLCHLVIKFLLASSLRLGYEMITKKRRVLLDCDNWAKKLSHIGISGGLDIGFSNWGQEFITVSLYTMSKSTAIIFILGFALFLKLEEMHWSLFMIVGMISGGLIMFTYKSTQFHLFGFSLIMAASLLSGLRWSMCQLIVQKSKLGLQNPIDMVYHVQPWMIIAVLPFAVFFEGNSLITRSPLTFRTMEEKADFLSAINSILIGALMAFWMEIAEYMVVTYTSSLTLSVASIFKEICTLCLAVIFNGDQLTFINFLGLLMCFTGICFHVGFKVFKSTKEIEQAIAVSSPGVGGGGSHSQTTGSRSSNSNNSSSGHQGHGHGPGSIPLQDTLLSKGIVGGGGDESETPLLNMDMDQLLLSGESDEESNLWIKS